MRVTTRGTFDKENVKYLEHFLGKEVIEIFRKGQKSTEGMTEEEQQTYKEVHELLTVMSGFGENRWWTSNDENEVGYYQTMCTYMLVPNNQYVVAVEFLLGRHVRLREFKENKEELKKEVAAAYKNGGQTRKKNPHSTK